MSEPHAPHVIRCPACGTANRVPREKIEQGLRPVCGRCRMMEPVLDDLAAQFAGRVRFAKLDVDENPVTAARFNVRSIPTLLVLKGGREVDRIVGVQPKAEIARRLERLAA